MLDSAAAAPAASGGVLSAAGGAHADDDTKKKKKGVDDNKWRRRVGFAGLCLGVVMSSAVFSLLAPFFPDVAAGNGVSEGTIGFIFAIFAFMVMVMSPYLGVKMDEFGSRKMMVFGLGLLGLSTVAFSVLDAIPAVHSNVFVGVSILLRILQGIGAAGSETASYALAAQLYPDDLSYAVGVMETLCVLCGRGVRRPFESLAC
jgi:MFS family permease